MRVMTISGAIAIVVVATVAVAGLVARNAWIKNKIAALSGPPAIAFAEDNSHLPSKRDRLRVVLIGDSSFGRLPTGKVDDRWQFINRGVGGETTAQIAQRFDRDALALSPDVVVLWAGVNDLVAAEFLDPAARRATVDRTFETLVDLTRRGAGRGVRVILATIAPPSRPDLLRLPVWRESVRDAVADVNRRIREFSAKSGVGLADFAAALDSGDRRTPEAYRADTLHLNAAGYQRVEQELCRALAD